jgi:hypothetical protein
MIEVSLPAMSAGIPYKECVTLTGTPPFSLVSHNIAKSEGSVLIAGSSLCIQIDSPNAWIDFAAEVKGGCASCGTETITAEIEYAEDAASCVCTPATIEPQVTPPLRAGQYMATVQLSGSMPFELCGTSIPKCLSLKLEGNLVTVSGRYDGAGDVTFSVKNACTCDCVTYKIAKE